MTDFFKENNEFGNDYFKKLTSDLSCEIFKEEFDLIIELMSPKPGERILDLGCGMGRAGLFVLSKEKNCDVTFSDISPMPGQYLSSYKFFQCSMTDTSFPDNSFDKIYSLSTISHIDDADKAIREMHRISKGQILLTTNNKWSVYVCKIASFFGLIPKFKYDKTVKKLYSMGSLRRLLEKNGFKIKNINRYGEYSPKKLKFNFLKTRLMVVAFK